MKNDPFETVARLARESRARKVAVWNQIQEEAPDVAEFLRQTRDFFGKPEKVSVVLKGKRVL